MSWRDRISSALVNAMQDIRPARENLWDVAGSNFNFGTVGRNAIVPMRSLQGGVGMASDDLARVKALADQMRSPQGYIERLIADDAGNVLEGQHRLDALRQLGAEDVPVSRIIDLARPYDEAAVREAVRGAGMRGDQTNQMMMRAFEAAHEYGSPQSAFTESYLPVPFQAPYEAALRAMGAR